MTLTPQNLKQIIATLEAKIDATHIHLADCIFLSNDWIVTNGRLIELEIQLEKMQSRLAQAS